MRQGAYLDRLRALAAAGEPHAVRLAQLVFGPGPIEAPTEPTQPLVIGRPPPAYDPYFPPLPPIPLRTCRAAPRDGTLQTRIVELLRNSEPLRAVLIAETLQVKHSLVYHQLTYGGGVFERHPLNRYLWRLRQPLNTPPASGESHARAIAEEK